MGKVLVWLAKEKVLQYPLLSPSIIDSWPVFLMTISVATYMRYDKLWDNRQQQQRIAVSLFAKRHRSSVFLTYAFFGYFNFDYTEGICCFVVEHFKSYAKNNFLLSIYWSNHFEQHFFWSSIFHICSVTEK